MERSIAFRMGYYMQQAFTDIVTNNYRELAKYVVDSEYKNNFDGPKKMYEVCSERCAREHGCYLSTDNNTYKFISKEDKITPLQFVNLRKQKAAANNRTGIYAAPDLLIHKRCDNQKNLLAVEIKTDNGTVTAALKRVLTKG